MTGKRFLCPLEKVSLSSGKGFSSYWKRFLFLLELGFSSHWKMHLFQLGNLFSPQGNIFIQVGKVSLSGVMFLFPLGMVPLSNWEKFLFSIGNIFLSIGRPFSSNWEKSLVPQVPFLFPPGDHFLYTL